MNKIMEVIDDIRLKHGVYTTVTIRPSPSETDNGYTGVCCDVYISEMPEGMHFQRGLTVSRALEVLTQYLNGEPKAIFTKVKLQKIKDLKECIAEANEQIATLRQG